MPATRDQRARLALGPRWVRTRRCLTVSLAMPTLVAVLCAGMLALAATGPGGYPWPVLVLLLGALAPAAVYAGSLRGRGVLAPSDWPKTAFVVCGVQLLVAAIPCAGIATATASAAGKVLAAVSFVLCWACLAVSVVAARRALQVLLTPLVPELGATRFTVPVGVRFALTAHDLISARLEIASDRLLWTVRAHRGRGAGPSAGGVFPFPFAGLRQVAAVELPAVPELHPWVALPDGTMLYAQPGPALLLTTGHGRWMVPVHDAAVLAAVIDLRRSS